jgi:ADP-heptose:LPS heptosyltransferase
MLYMTVPTLQSLDRWLGIPLCFALSVLRGLLRRSVPPASAPLRNLLFVKLAEQGSTVLAYPALQRAVALVGRENVYFIALEGNRFILDVLGVIPEENVITVSFGSFPSLLRSGLGAIVRLRRLKLDAAVDMEFFSRGSAALSFLTGARRRVGFHAFFGAGPYRGNLMTHRLLYNPYLHTSQTFQTLVEALRCEPSALPTCGLTPPLANLGPPLFEPRPDELAAVGDMMRRETGDEPRLILLNPNASDLLPLRRWPTERYVELAKRLLVKYPEALIGFTGAPIEAEATAELVRQVGSRRCVSFAGKTTLRQLLVLYTLADVLVTNDSGPAHFAVLTPIQVVTLFGPETPALYAAVSPRNSALWAGLACSPCVNAYNNRQSPCRNNLCLQAITVEQVFAATCRAYQAKGVKRPLGGERRSPQPRQRHFPGFPEAPLKPRTEPQVAQDLGPSRPALVETVP